MLKYRVVFRYICVMMPVVPCTAKNDIIANNINGKYKTREAITSLYLANNVFPKINT